MFGYIRVFKPDLTFREYEQYRGVYCSLCETLGKRYGFCARMTLSYDFTFLALFRMALSGEQPSFYEGRCPFHPTKKQLFLDGDNLSEIAYAADVAVLLTYHKCTDTIQDERFFKKIVAWFIRGLLRRDYKKAVKRCPDEAAWAQEFMDAQKVLEREGVTSIDAAAHPTAEFLSRISSVGILSEEVSSLAKRFGYCLGRFIYLADAAEDLNEDVKRGRYNVYSFMQEDCAPSELQDYIVQSLHNNVAVCEECFNELSLRHFDSIIRNVLYGGLPFVIQRIQKSMQEDSTS